MSTETQARAADRVGEETLEIFAANEAYNRFLWRVLNRLSPICGRVLEVGCGIGNITRLAAAEPGVTAVHGLDPEPAYVERVRELGLQGVDASVATLEEFRAPAFPAGEDASYDAIFSSNVFEHIEDDVEAMRQVARLLKLGGEASILVPAHPCLFCGIDTELSHFRRYTPARLRELAEGSGLELLRTRHFNPLAAAGWWWNGKVRGRRHLPAEQVKSYARWGLPLSKVVDRLNFFPVGISIIGLFRRAH